MKRIISILTIIAILIIIMPIYSTNTMALTPSEITSKITSWQSQLNDKYWNYYKRSSWDNNRTTVENNLKAATSYLGNSNATNAQLGVTTTPCSGSLYENGCESNYFGGGWQCYGFARWIEYALYGSYPVGDSGTDGYVDSNGWKYMTSVSSLQPGDYIRADGHSAVVWKVSGSTVYVIQCWGGSGCKINYGTFWGNSNCTTLSSILNTNFVCVWRHTSSSTDNPSDDSLTISGYNYPTSINEGDPFGIYGMVTSGYSNITSLTVGVYDTSGTMKTGKTVSPYSTYYSISNVDAYVRFDYLTAGSYYYRVTATNASGTTQLLNKQFTVVGKSPAVTVVKTVACARKVSLPARVIDLYWNPTDTERATYFSYGPTVSCPEYAELSDGRTMYKANVNHNGEDTQMWFQYESDMSVTVNHTYGEVQYEEEHPHAAYETCACGYVHYTGANGSRDDCTECYPVSFTGTCGDNLTWVLNTETGMLTISGSGEMTNWADSWAVPWYSKRDYIKSVSIGNNVTSIGFRVFCGCSKLTSVTIGNSVMSIGMHAFDNCSGLTSITIPDSVTDIDWYAFQGCSGLTSIYIPNSVTSVSVDAFYGCSGLTSITVDRNNTVYDSRNNCNAIIETATNTLIAGCKKTVIPNSITSIGANAFGGCTGLTSVTIPNGVMNIRNGAFQGCTGLKTITIPDSVTNIGSYVFNRTGYYNDISNWNGDLLYIGNHLIAANETISGACSIKPGTRTIAGRTFEDCTGLTSVTIPDSLIGIGDNSFDGCAGLTSITIPDSVTSIGKSAFRGCNGLTDVYFHGTEEEWNAIKIEASNEPLTGATLHFIHTHSYSAVVTAPTCSDNGYTTHTCAVCGESYVDNYVPALGHDYKDGVCTICGAKDPNYKPTEPVNPTEPSEPTEPANPTEPSEPTEATDPTEPTEKPTVEFTDVAKKAWYYDAVEYAVTNGLMNGVGKNQFDPEGTMTRAMLVTVLWRYEGEPEAPASTFSDVKAGTWYSDAVSWASANGVVNGVGNNKFDPEGNITREQMATILYRYCSGKGIDTSKQGSLSGFPDADKVSSYAKTALQWTVAEGIIGGSDGKLLPQGNATRAQVATILMRFIENIAE